MFFVGSNNGINVDDRTIVVMLEKIEQSGKRDE